MTLKTKLMAASGIAAAVAAKLFGGFTKELVTLLVLMAADFLTGLIVAGVFGRSPNSKGGSLESGAGWKGISKKVVTLFFVIAAHRLDVLMNTDFLKTAVAAAYSVNEAVSLIENAGLMGIPVPAPLKRAIDILKNDNNSGKDE